MTERDDDCRQLREKAEAKLSPADYKDVGTLSRKEVETLIHDLRVHQIELELQNEELRRVQERLEETRDGYARLYNQAPVGYLTLDRNGIISKCNHTFRKMAGIEDRQDPVGKALAEMLTPKSRDVFLARYNAFFKRPEGKDIDVTLRVSESENLPVRLTGRSEAEDPFHSGGGTSKESLLVIVSDVSAQKRAEAEVMMLLREVHHRIKNNMNTVAVLLDLQAESMTDTQAEDALHEARNRIMSMLRIYDKLYLSSDFRNIDIADYLPALINDIVTVIATAPHINVHTDIDSIILNPTTSFPVGIIVNELITNALKYAFPERDTGRIDIAVKTVDSGWVAITVSDDGVGIPAHVRCGRKHGFGLELVESLTSQIGGTLEFADGPGTTVKVVFPV